MANQPPRGHWREVNIEQRTIAHLREQLALKFCYKVENLLSVTTTKEVGDQIADELIEDDQQVVALREYQRLFVQFKGRPDPGMSAFAARLKKVQKARAAGEGWLEGDEEQGQGKAQKVRRDQGRGGPLIRRRRGGIDGTSVVFGHLIRTFDRSWGTSPGGPPSLPQVPLDPLQHRVAHEGFRASPKGSSESSSKSASSFAFVAASFTHGPTGSEFPPSPPIHSRIGSPTDSSTAS